MFCFSESYNQTPSTFTAGPEAYRMKRWALPRIETLAKGSTSSSKMVVDVTIPGSNIHPYISLISQKHFWHFWRDFPLIRPCSWSLEIGLNCRCVGGWKDGADCHGMEHFFHAVINMELVSYMMTKDTIKNTLVGSAVCLTQQNNSQGKYQAMPTRWYSQICDSWQLWSCHFLVFGRLSSSC